MILIAHQIPRKEMLDWRLTAYRYYRKRGGSIRHAARCALLPRDQFFALAERVRQETAK